MMQESDNHTSKYGVIGSAMRRYLTPIIMLCLHQDVALAVGAEFDEELMFSDWESRAAEVNEGELTVLDTPPDRQVHQHINHLIIDEASVQTGWVTLEQCHHGLDAVPALQITFAPGRVKDLVITESVNIGRSWVEAHTVQLKNVAADSRLCLSARTLALNPAENTAVLSNGPYMRRFLDGFYPMRVKLKITYPESHLRFNQSSPMEFDLVKAGEILLDVWFEGELRTTVFFDRI